jgi:hypothetical protein
MIYKTVKIEKDLHSRIKNLAAQKGYKLEKLTAQLLDKALRSEEPKEPKDKKKESRHVLFRNSEYANFELFAKKLTSMKWFQKYKGIDPQMVYDALMSWSNAKGKTAIDWIAQAHTFVRKSPAEFMSSNVSKRDIDWANWLR